jgi:dephospho-CoA kinase
MSQHIGLTGGMGAGKTFVSKVFQAMGIPVYNSDIQAKQLMNGEPVKTMLIDAFGPEIYKDHALDRAYVASLVFSDKNALATINSIVHPEVGKDYRKWALLQKGAPYLLKESAILIENQLVENLDGLISVIAPIRLRIKRIQLRENISEIDILKRLNNQTTDEVRLKKSEYLIINAPSHVLLKQIQGIHQSLLNK